MFSDYIWFGHNMRQILVKGQKKDQKYRKQQKLFHHYKQKVTLTNGFVSPLSTDLPATITIHVYVSFFSHIENSFCIVVSRYEFVHLYHISTFR